MGGSSVGHPFRRSAASAASAASTALVVLVAACASGATTAPSQATASALAPGTYTSRAFQPAVTYTVPAGWDAPDDSATYLRLRPAGSEVVGVHLFRDPSPASQDAACPDTAQPGVGGSSAQLATWLRSLPGLVVGNPQLASVGGLRGTLLDIGIAEGWTQSCPFANGSPTVPLFLGSKGEYRWIAVGSERLRLYLLDIPGGGMVVVDIDAFDGALMDALIAEATPIVQGMKFVLP
jgi:hypothetical protein